jgi:DNA-binding MarR family transcriptional regulator
MMAGMSPPESAAQLTQRTGYLAHKVGYLIIRDVEEALEPLKVSSRSYFVLAAVGQSPPPSQNDLARLLSIDPTTIVAVVDELERAGLIARRRNVADRRRYDLVLTPAGAETLDRAHQIADETEARFFAPLNRAQRDQLHGFLALLLQGRWPAPGRAG